MVKPWKLNDPAKGQGFEPAVAYAVAKRLGFAASEVVWVYSPFNKTIAPGNKAFDFAINQVSYTPQRRRRLPRRYYRQPVDRRGQGQADLPGALDRRPQALQTRRSSG